MSRKKAKANLSLEEFEASHAGYFLHLRFPRYAG